MRELKFILAIILFLLTLSCSNDNTSEFYNSSKKEIGLQLDKINEIIIDSASNDSIKIGNLRYEFVSNRDNSLFAFYDEIMKQFLITENSGAVRSIISDEGKGPGEIVKVGGYNFNEQNQLVVFDDALQRITTFSLNGEVIQTSSIENDDYYFGGQNIFTNNDRIFTDVINSSYLHDLENAWKSDLLGIYDHSGKLLNTFGKYDQFVKDAKSYLIFPIIDINFKKNYLVSVQSSGYSIQKYDLESKKRIGWFGRKTHNFNESEEYISPQQSRQNIKEQSIGVSFPASIHITEDNYIILHFENLTDTFFQTNNYNDKENYINVYDSESLDLYDEFKIPYALGNIANEKIYLIENDNPENYTIGVYELNKKS